MTFNARTPDGEYRRIVDVHPSDEVWTLVHWGLVGNPPIYEDLSRCINTAADVTEHILAEYLRLGRAKPRIYFN